MDSFTQFLEKAETPFIFDVNGVTYQVIAGNMKDAVKKLKNDTGVQNSKKIMFQGQGRSVNIRIPVIR
jgi:hypothetical protein